MVPPTAVTEATAAPGSNVSAKDPEKDTILTPRFYTTDFEAMAAMDLRPNEAELEAICEEFRKDYNRHHFVRNGEFDGAAEQLDPETRKCSLNFLSRVVRLNFPDFCSTRTQSSDQNKKSLTG
jgi:magnesium-protoporphyrin IX monomethyl ester (oxidative) cyclase